MINPFTKSAASLNSRLVFGDDASHIPTQGEIDTLDKVLLAAREHSPETLSNTLVALHDNRDESEQHLPSEEAFYAPAEDVVVSHTRSPAVLLHELGHAVDFNRPRLGGKFTRAILTRTKPSWMSEPTAWKYAERIAAESPDLRSDNNFAKAILEDIYLKRAPALGTYFGALPGAALGVAGGSFLGHYLGRDQGYVGQRLARRLGMVLGGIGGGMLGSTSGAALGNLWANREGAAERYADRKLEEYDPKELDILSKHLNTSPA